MIYNQLRIKALFVRAKGIEPIRLAAPDPKSGLSTNFNTPAYGLHVMTECCLVDCKVSKFILIPNYHQPTMYLLFGRKAMSLASTKHIM